MTGTEYGQVPGEFNIELTIRTVTIYALLIIAMRLLGKRLASQLSRNEMIAMTSQPAAIGIPIQSALLYYPPRILNFCKKSTGISELVCENCGHHRADQKRTKTSANTATATAESMPYCRSKIILKV